MPPSPLNIKSFIFNSASYSFIAIAWSLLFSRFMSIFSLVVFSYFIGPEPFATFGVFSAIVLILWTAVFGCYEQAILICNEIALPIIVRICEFVSIAVVGSVAVICVLLFLTDSTLLLYVKGMNKIILLIPLTLAARAIHRLMSHLATRNGQFSLVAKLNWVQAIVQATTLLLLMFLGLPGIVCLVTAELFGLIAITSYCLRAFPPFRQVMLARVDFADIRSCAREWSFLPTWRLLMSLTSVFAVGLPSLTIPLHYPAAIAGQILFAMRMLDVPSNVISGAVSPILQGKLMSPDRSRRSALREVWLTGGINAVVFSTLGVAAYLIQPYFEGTAWMISVGAFVPLTLYYIGLTTSAPFVGSVVGPRVERASAVCQIGFLVANGAVVALIAGGLPLTWVLVAFGLSMLLRALAFAVLYVRQIPLAATAGGTMLK